MKRVLILTIVFISMLSVVSAQKSPIYAPKGVALEGYDAVAFFAKGKPIKGSPLYAFHWSGVEWQFVDKADLESFQKTPEKYAPQYGGYCAYGAAEGHKAPTEVDTWTILDNKLYLNYNQKIKSTWVKNQAAYIESANKKWPMIKDKE